MRGLAERAYGGTWYERPRYFTIGGPKDDVSLAGKDLRAVLSENEFIPKDASEWTHNGRPLAGESVSLEKGDTLRSEGFSMTFLGEHILLEAEGGIRTGLVPIDTEKKFFDGFPRYSRSPRALHIVDPHAAVRLEKPQKLQGGKPAPLWQSLAGPLVMMVIMALVCVFLRRGIFILLSAGGMAVSVIVSVTRHISSKKDREEEKKNRERAYGEYLLRKRKEIRKKYGEEERAWKYNYPSPHELETIAREYTERLYERRITDRDALTVSLGWKDAPADLKIELSTSEVRVRRDPLEEEAEALVKEFSRMRRPVLIDLKKENLGIIGDRKHTLPIVERLIAQIAVLHSYCDVNIVLLHRQEDEDAFRWARWLPHTRIESVNCLGIIGSERKRDLVLGSIYQILKDRKAQLEDREAQRGTHFLPHLVFVVDEPRWCESHPIMDYIGSHEEELGYSVIYTAAVSASLPDSVTAIAEALDASGARLILKGGEAERESFDLDPDEGVSYEWLARDLSAIDHVHGLGSRFPDRFTFLDMYGADTVEDIGMLKRWARADTTRSLSVPVGARSEDELLFLDLHEQAHGPHGLIAGTTGAGKSVLISTFILSLALNFSPYDAGFLLIDYKGGGMAKTFRGLPHLLGIITNLDGDQSLRALISMKAELDRRQETFNMNGVNHIDDYTRLFRMGKVADPMPHLFIISDEFAELRKEQPDFMNELISTARIGRSLGVHLILATQKPAGIVSEQIWSNSNFRIALRMQSASDSKEVLHTPDAASITKPGRAYLQVGSNEVYELFQSAFCEAPYKVKNGRQVQDDAVYLINSLGQKRPLNPDNEEEETDGLTETQLAAVERYITRTYAPLGMKAVKKPWLPPLAEQIITQEETRKGDPERADTLVRIGILDIPEERAQEVYAHDLSREGNILFVGTSGSGRTAFLTTCVLSLAGKNTVSLLNFYILDFGNAGLVRLRGLPHVSDYIPFDDEERKSKFMRIIQTEIEERKRAFARNGAASLSFYNRTAKEKLPVIVCVIDNYDAIREEAYETGQLYVRAARDGSSVGIYMIVTASRSGAVPFSASNSYRKKIAGYLPDKAEVSALVGRSKYTPSEIRGRTLVRYRKGTNYMQVFAAADMSDEDVYAEGLLDRIRGIGALYPGQHAPRIPVIPETFLHTSFGEYGKRPAEIYIGLAKEKVELVGVDRPQTPFLILGEIGRGASNILKVITEQASRKGRTFVFDSKSRDLFFFRNRPGIRYAGSSAEIRAAYDEIYDISEERERGVEGFLAKNPSLAPADYIRTLAPSYIVIDDIDDFVEQTMAMNKEMKLGYKETEFMGILEHALHMGMVIFASGNSGKMRKFDDLTKFLKTTTDGLLIGTQGSLAVFPLRSYKDKVQFRDGFLYRKGVYETVRLPLFDASAYR